MNFSRTGSRFGRLPPAPLRAGAGGLRRGFWLLLFVAAAASSRGQGFLAPPSVDYRSDASLSIPFLAESGGIAPEAGLLEAPGLLAAGLVDLHPRVFYRLLYTEGLPTSPTNRVNTIDQQFSAGFLMNIGPHWSLSYAPALNIYSSRQLGGASQEVDQALSLKGITTYRDWGFSLSQSYSHSDSVLLQTETPTVTDTYATSFGVNRALGSKLSAQVGVSQMIQSEAESGASQGMEAWSLTAGLHYQVWSHFGVGLSGSAAYDHLSPGGDMTSEQGNASMNWLVGQKLTVAASAGINDTQFGGGQVADPVFSASLIYRPLEQTTASISGSRTVSPSYFEGLVEVTTSLSATVRQRLFKHFSLEISGGYTQTPYDSFETFTPAGTSGGASATAFPLEGGETQIPGVTVTKTSTLQVNRRDSSTFVRVSLSCPVLKKGTASVFYEDLENNSTLSTYSVSSTQVGMELGFHF